MVGRRHPTADGNDDLEKRRRHIREMQERLDELAGGDAHTFLSPDCDTELHEKFLEYVLAFEESEQKSLTGELLRRGIDLPHPDQLDDEKLHSKLWEVIQAMALLGAYLYNTDHLSDRELYQRLWAEILPEPTALMPQNPHFAQHIDLVGTGSEEDLHLYLKYYADDEYRRSWAESWPGDAIPDHEKPPYDRDRLLP